MQGADNWHPFYDWASWCLALMNNERGSGDIAHTGYMSKEAYYQACYSLVEHSQNNDAKRVRFEFHGEV